MSKTRTRFHRQITEALQLAEPAIASIWGHPPPTLQIINRQSVTRIVSRWSPTVLNWGTAVRKCGQIPRSCFIGVKTKSGAIPILALIRLSNAHLHTNLLFTEKNTGHVPARMGMVVVDAILEVIAESFGSEKIVLDDPLPELVDYYRGFGYEFMRKHGRESPAMFKTAIVR